MSGGYGPSTSPILQPRKGILALRHAQPAIFIGASGLSGRGSRSRGTPSSQPTSTTWINTIHSSSAISSHKTSAIQTPIRDPHRETAVERSRPLSSKSGRVQLPNVYRRLALISSFTRLPRWPTRASSGPGSSTCMLGEGKDVADVCRELGVAEQTYYRCRIQFGGLKPDNAKRLKERERENATLKRLLADAELHKAALTEIARGEF